MHDFFISPLHQTRKSFVNSFNVDQYCCQSFIWRWAETVLHCIYGSWWVCDLCPVFYVRSVTSLGAWWGVRVHAAVCLRSLHPHSALGGAGRESFHLLRQKRILFHRHIPHQTLLRREGPQVRVQRLVFESLFYLRSGQTVFLLSFSNRVTAEVKHNPTGTIVCKAQGEWNGTLEFTYSSGETKVIDTSKLPVIKKKIRPLEKQGQYESRWGDPFMNLASVMTIGENW